MITIFQIKVVKGFFLNFRGSQEELQNHFQCSKNKIQNIWASKYHLEQKGFSQMLMH